MEFREIPINNDDPKGGAYEEKPAYIDSNEIARKRLAEAGIEAKPEEAGTDYLKDLMADGAERKKQKTEAERRKRLEELRREILGK